MKKNNKNQKIPIITYKNKYERITRKFIFTILEKELKHVGIERPDLDNIEKIYQKQNGNFWIALDNNKVVGTIALRNYGNGKGYIKRMAVHKLYRGSGLAEKLLIELLNFAKKKKYKKIYLDVIKESIAANKFYKKHGFVRILKIPKIFPKINYPQFGHSIFYVYKIPNK